MVVQCWAQITFFPFSPLNSWASLYYYMLSIVTQSVLSILVNTALYKVGFINKIALPLRFSFNTQELSVSQYDSLVAFLPKGQALSIYSYLRRFYRKPFIRFWNYVSIEILQKWTQMSTLIGWEVITKRHLLC
jgi:hypothetical protein